MTKLTFILTLLVLLCSSFSAKSSHKEIIVSPEIVKVGPDSPTVKQQALNLENVSEEEFDPVDVAALKTIRNNLPAGNSLKSLWIDDSKIGQWSNVTWTDLPPRKVKSINLNSQGLSVLDISSFSALENLSCDYNKLTSLNASNLKMLVAIYCPNNQLNSIDITGSDKINRLICYSNKIPFSKLPVRLPALGGYYEYYGQTPFQEEITVSIGETVDYSSEATINGVATTFKWFRNNMEVAEADQSGKYTITEEGYYYCQMTNTQFPNLVITTKIFKVGNPPNYDPNDLNALRAIRDNTPSGSPLRSDWADESRIAYWPGVSWSENPTKRVIYLDVRNKNLATLDISKLVALESFSCANNKLSSINISGLTKLKNFACNNNKIPFSQLPLKLPVTGGINTYFPQESLYDKTSVTEGELLDYSSEAIIDGSPTVFTWYKDNVVITNADQSGKYSPTQQGYYYCKMTNAKFPQLIQTTTLVKLGNPPEFDPVDVAGLKAIRDNAPLDSPLKTKWANEANIGSWEGVYWTSLPSKKVTKLMIWDNKLTSIDLSPFSNLEYVYCNRNNLVELKCEGLKNLKELDCIGNKLSFANLPLVSSLPNVWYSYGGQRKLYEERSINIGETIDYSFESLSNGKGTVFTWYKDNVKIEGTDQSGKYTPLTAGYYWCVMTNSLFPGSTLTTNAVKAGTPEEFDPRDVLVLKTIRDMAPEGSTIKSDWADETKIGSWSGVKWSEYKSRRVTELNFYDKKVTDLDVTALTELGSLSCSNLRTLNVKGLAKLTIVNCSGGYLTSIDLTGLIKLYVVNCSYNKIPMSKIPLKLPASGATCVYNPQNPLFEERNIVLGETIDYSSEAMVGNKPTTFRWYKNGELIPGTDQTGKYTPVADGYYTCKMTNPNFTDGWLVEFTTSRVTLGSVAAYDPVDVAALKAIRDNAPVGSKPKNYWTDDSKIGTWEGVQWSQYPPRKVIGLGLSDGILTSLDVSLLSSLKRLSCNNNYITSLKINEKAKLEYLSCYFNKLTFSTLPLNPTDPAREYYYNNQKEMDTERSINLGETIDYSSEAVIGGVPTTFKWYKNNLFIENADQSGKYTPVEEGYYYCRMTNSQLPLLVLASASIKVGNPSVYDPREVAALKAIRDNAPADSPLKLAWSDESKIGTWAGVTWNNVKPYQVQYLYINNKKLTSLDVSSFKNITILNCAYNSMTSLDLRGLEKLYHIECDNNYLTSLNVSGLTKITSLNCSNNKLTFSNIPRSTTGEQYYAAYQRPLFEEKTINAGETIDYSSEAIFEGIPTSFVWYKNDIKIEGTDQTGRYTPTSEGFYTCKMTNARIPNLTLYTSAVKLGSIEPNDPQDVAVLKSIRDNAPNDSPLKTLWADDAMINTWQGVTWSTYLPRKVIHLSVEGKKLITLELQKLTALISLGCSNNALTLLDIAGLANLKYINCSNNKLTAIDQVTGTKASILNCSYNYIPLSKLPFIRKPPFSESYEYTYSPQNKIYAERSISLGETIDYSSEVLINGNNTIFTWYHGDFKIEGTDQSGKLTPKEEGYYYCIMSNVNFPNLNITTNKVKVGNPAEFSPEDVAALIAIRDKAPSNSPLKTLWADETKIGTWDGVGWTIVPTKRVTTLDVSNRELTSLEVSKLTALQFLYCNNNKLSSIDLTGTNLSALSCSYNKMTFSKLPLSLPGNATSKSIMYFPQGVIYEERRISLGETIDFSSEALVDGISTVFTWFRNGIKILNTDQSGRYTPAEEGYYYCTMTNTRFSYLTITTKDIIVGSPPEFDMQDVNTLKAIRDNAPASSRLKTDWADETKIGTWSGVAWNETRSRKVKALSVAWLGLTTLDVSNLTYLEELNCNNNNLKVLNLKPLTRLRECNCSNNFLSFSNIILQFPVRISYFTFSPQGLLFEPRTIAPGQTIDYSAEVVFDGVSTVFTWYRNNVKIENTNQTGKYTPILEGYYYCTFTNAKFPRLTLTTHPVKVGNPPEYDPQNLATLKAIRDHSPEASPLRNLWKDDNNVATWQGVVWSQSFPKQLKELYISGYGLTTLDFPSVNAIEILDCSNNYLTSIDLRNLPALRYVTCSKNLLTSINITGLTQLAILDCNYNQLIFSKLPQKLPVYSSYYYSGQTYPAIQQPNTIGSIIDYSSEAMIDGIATKYTWYRNGTVIAGTDNSGRYVISGEGYYYCVLTNLKFSGLSISTQQVKVGNLPEYDSQDILVLKAIRDSAPSDSPLKTYWADETKIGTWPGVKWSTYFPRKVKTLSISNMMLKELDVRQLTDLTDLYCSSNFLAMLDVSGMSNLQYINCQNNQITSINISSLTGLYTLDCSQNRIPFSQLPVRLLNTGVSFAYWQQTPFGEVSSKAIGEVIDYSSEAIIDGTTTSFVWYKNNVKIEGTDNSGKFTPTTEGFYHCTMSNSKFRNLIITTAKATVGNPIEFDPQDVVALKTIRDNASPESTIKTQWADDKPINTWPGISWSETFPKKVKSFYVTGSKLGSLDVTKLTSLETLACQYNDLKILRIEGLANLSIIYCHGNQLETIDLTGCPKVKTLYCHTNKLSFSKLPLKLSESGGTYMYSPQQKLYEERTITLGDAIDYSEEALIDGTKTVFKWLKNNIQLTEIDQSGVLIPTEDGYYICQMTNSKFPGLTIETNSVKLGTPSEYDPKNVAALKAIRDLAPENSPLKTLWADSKPLENWTGVLWSLTYPKVVISLNVNGMQINVLNVKEISKLEMLICSQNNIATLDLSGLPNLMSLNCSDNQLTALDITQSPKLKQLNVANNYLSFSKLPYFSNYYSYTYKPQKVLYEEKSMELGETIDYSSESNIYGMPTTFTWYKDNVRIEGTDQTGKYKPTSNGSYYCSMTNPNFYYLILTTNHINVGTQSEYNASDLAILISIRDNAPADSPLKTQWADGSMPGAWPGVEWSSNAPKKVIRLNVSDKKLTSLNVSQLTELVNLVCSNNQITGLNVTGLTKLNSIDCSFNQITFISLTGSTGVLSLDCSNNKIPLSKLPVRLPVSGGNYQYQPMNLIFEEQSLVLGEPINYMTEALIDGAFTVFTWYKNDQIILSTDQSGKFIPLEVGNYHCSMTNSKFPGLTLTTYDVKIYQLPEFDIQDVEALKAIRNNAPEGSPLKTLWADDSKFSEWDGVTWSTYLPKQVRILQLSQKGLESLDVSPFSGLEQLYCNNNQLTSLKINGLLNLNYLSCAYNLLSSLDITEVPKLLNLFCHNNKISFSKLPLRLSVSGGNYQYWPQQLIFEEQTIKNGETIDFSSEAIIDGKATVFSWYKDNTLIPGVGQSGKLQTTEGGSYYCILTNTKFPALTLTTNKISVITTPPALDASDIAALKTIRDNAPEDSPLKIKWTDTTTVESWTGVTWTETSPKRVQELELSSNNLIVLDVTNLPVLEKLDCSDNQLLSLNVNDLANLQQLDLQNNELLSIDLSGVSNLEVLNCSNNRLLLSQLPSSLPIENDNYLFLDQKSPFEDDTIMLGETIDFSKEALIDGVATEFTWYLDSTKIDLTDQTGKYKPITGGKYYCTMTNSKFPGLIISSGIIEVKSPQVNVNNQNLLSVPSIYPNPTDGKVFIEFPIRTDRGTLLSVLDITGKLLLKKTVILQKEQIHLNDFPAGVYFIMINNSNYSNTYKIKLY